MDTAPLAPLTCEEHGQSTRITCVDCSKPVCPKCLVRTAVGIKCDSCAKPAEVPKVIRSRRRSPLPWLLGGGGMVVVVVVVLLLVLMGGSPSVPLKSSPALGTWRSVASVPGIRGTTSVVTLADGHVLAAGGGVNALPIASAAIYDPRTATWAPTGSLNQARRGAGAVALKDGKVLVAGGIAGSKLLSSAELYNPSTGKWKVTGSMGIPRLGATLTLLRDGNVLTTGGTTDVGIHGTGGGQAITPTASAELYNPSTGKWSSTGSMMSSRFDATATALNDGRVLVAGGFGGPGTPAQGGGLQFGALRSAELYDPNVSVFTSTGPMTDGRAGQVAALLGNGDVLVAGGFNADGTTALATAELFDPSNGTWALTGGMSQAREGAAATTLAGGDVLVVGGEDVSQGTEASLQSAELFQPSSKSWRSAGKMACPRSGLGLANLADGGVIAVAGDDAFPGQAPMAQSCVDLYRPASPPTR
ncbi:MAG: kelch repeat-containing protein [Acidimicrobiales bacterium]